MTEAPTARMCYRHPGQAAGVVCQRCDRPICPQCMSQASVGFHCPECARKGAQKVIRGAQALGAGFRPMATYVLIAINVAVWAIGQAMGSEGSIFSSGNVLGLRGGLLAKGGLFDAHGTFVHSIGVAHGEWWRVVTSGFLHDGIFHLGMNMWALYVLGMVTERVFGRSKFVAVYFTAMLAGSFGALLVSPNELTVGASGAIFGLMGALLVIAKSRGIRMADTGLLGVLAINLLITVSIPGISLGGHLGGLAGGAVAGFLIIRVPELVRGSSANIQTWGPILACVVVGVVLAVGSVATANTAQDKVGCVYAAHPSFSNVTLPGCYGPG